MNIAYHLLNKHNFSNVPSRRAITVCGRAIGGLHRVGIRDMGARHNENRPWCPECLAHPKLALYILEETEL